MRFLCSLARTLSLMLFVSACASVASADTPPASTSPARWVQIQCVAVRARMNDVDAFGFNFDVALPKSYLLPSVQSLSYANIANGTHVAEMLRSLTEASSQMHHTPSTPPVLTLTDGRSGVISLAGLSDPGLAKTPWLIVIPHVQADGKVRLFIAPQFQFVCTPSTPSDPAATSTDAFPIERTLVDSDMMVFTEQPRPVPLSEPKTPPVGLPYIRSVSGHVRNIGTTELCVFLTVTVLPETSVPTSSVESPHHA